MNDKKCNGIKSVSTGEWIVGIDEITGKISWGNASEAACFSKVVQKQILDELNNPEITTFDEGSGDGFVGGRPDRPKP